MVEDGEFLDLVILATELRMTVLVEVCEADQLMQVRSAIGFPHAAYSVLAINNRCLGLSEADVGTTLRLMHSLGRPHR